MPELEMPELDKILAVEESRTTYEGVGTVTQGSYSARYSSRLLRTDISWYQLIGAIIPDDYTMTSAGFERAIQREIEESGKDPRKDIDFDLYVQQWTTTALRTPNGWEDGRRDEAIYRATGKEKYPRIVLEGDKLEYKEVAELLIPNGDGLVVTAWYEEFGIPSETEEMAWPHEPYTTHFWFNPDPSVDKRSGYRDVGIKRRGDKKYNDHGGCLNVVASGRRWISYPGDGFRPAGRGIILPQFEKFVFSDRVSFERGVEEGRKILLAEIQEDLKKISFQEFLRKYKIK